MRWCKASGEEAVLRFLRWSAVAITLILPLLVFPGTEHPFSTPKFALLGVACGVGLLSAVCCETPRRLALPFAAQMALVAWLGALGASASFGAFASPSALLLPVLAVAWCVVITVVQPKAEHLALALVLSGAVVAAIALLQRLGLDPFVFAGWVPLIGGNPRMRVFATLGNPNFVAALLSGLLPLTFFLASQSRQRRGWLALLFLLQAAAIIATGSRAPILALVFASLWIACLQSRKLARAFGLLALAVVFCAVGFSPARNLKTTLHGRGYIWKVAAPHLLEHFLFGLGPGGFSAAFPAWETHYWHAVPNQGNWTFTGVEDHAHNDYLEVFVDTGVVGLLALLTVLFVFLRHAWLRARAASDHLVVGASAGVVALAAVALVDFPLMRPAESFAFWSLLAVSLVGQSVTPVIRHRFSEAVTKT